MSGSNYFMMSRPGRPLSLYYRRLLTETLLIVVRTLEERLIQSEIITFGTCIVL